MMKYAEGIRPVQIIKGDIIMVCIAILAPYVSFPAAEPASAIEQHKPTISGLLREREGRLRERERELTRPAGVGWGLSPRAGRLERPKAFQHRRAGDRDRPLHKARSHKHGLQI
jgi:hypothetical protein